MTNLELKVTQKLTKIIKNYKNIISSTIVKNLLKDEAKQLIEMIRREDEN